MRPIRVVIVDDDALVRRALRVFLEDADDIEVVAEAPDGIAGVALVEQQRPDIVLLDMQMPRMGGVQAAHEIVRAVPNARILAITTFGSIDMILPMLRAGASGYLLKDAEPEAIIDAVRLVHAGAAALSAAITARLIEAAQTGDVETTDEFPDGHLLSEREHETLMQLALGRSNAEIARSIHASESTVKTHVSSIMAKWRVNSRVQIIIRAARGGLVRFD
ncbi:MULTISPECIES: response regulator transcription factor [Microbacterium]|uniref:response regulator transcription factor n=1 Tax=Microbacterium TaxID=33882 RepID=UPI0025F7C1D1|nr:MULTISPECIES: response regulator transcription factor [Microbacterium]